MLSVISFWQPTPKRSKLLSYPISFCMVVYDISYRSYLGLVNEAFIQTSSTISLLRMRKKENESLKNRQS